MQYRRDLKDRKRTDATLIAAKAGSTNGNAKRTSSAHTAVKASVAATLHAMHTNQNNVQSNSQR